METSFSVVPDAGANESGAEAVRSVCDRVSMGVPFRLALALEGLSAEAYEAHVRRHPNLAALQDAADAAFVEDCIRRLLKAPDPSSNIRWLLERLHPQIFAERRENAATKLPTIVGMSEEELRVFRDEAKRL
jgi:hypothetical protein